VPATAAVGGGAGNGSGGRRCRLPRTRQTCDIGPVFELLGRLISRHPKPIVAVWLVLAVATFTLASVGVGRTNLFDLLSTGEPRVAGTESDQAQKLLAADEQGASLTLAAEGIAPDTKGLADLLQSARNDLAGIDGVDSVIDPLALPGGISSPLAAPLLAKNGQGFLVVVYLKIGLSPELVSAGLDKVEARLVTLRDDLGSLEPGATGIVGGNSLIVSAITGQIERDLTTGEAVALPIALVVMVLVFGGFLAASMPMVGALASIATGLGLLYGIAHVVDLDSSVVNVVTLLGLGLSIDYGLLIVSRYREELHRLVTADDGMAVRRRRGDGAVVQALIITIKTAGRTVTFSALTVGIAVAGLMVFRPSILRAFGIASVSIVLIALLTALTLVPAALVLAGRRLARPGLAARIPGLRTVLARTADVRSEEGAFSRLAGGVQRHPWWVIVGTLGLLVTLASPLMNLQFRNSGIELLPTGNTQREFVALLADEYPASSRPTLWVIGETTLDSATSWVGSLSAVPGVASVDSPTTSGPYVVVGVRAATSDAGGNAAQDVVKRLRGLHPPFRTWVAGQAANQIDFVSSLRSSAPAALAIVVLATFILLFLMTGSLVVPLKALVVNSLSLAASLGVLVWVFQEGHFQRLLGYTSTGGIETYVIALVLAFGFGLAMDYEVFLLSRIKEFHDRGRPNNESVRLGLQRSGRIITSAAAIMVVVFGGFIFGKLLVIKEVGFALAVVVVVDATIVRLLLVPATMTVLGRANWWAPRRFKALYERFSLTH
jgi:RND superfamily putative drug exporter